MASTIKVGKKIYPSKTQGVFNKVYNENWGVYLKACDDPEGVLSEEDINGIRIHDEFPRLPKEYWSAWVSLCFYMCPKGSYLTDSRYHDKQLEVGAYLLRKADDKSKWKIIVPRQAVSGTSVKATLADSIDLITGERHTQFPPPGYKHAGSTHSHNKMGAFFSGTDDKSELGSSGLHIVVGKIDHKERKYAHVTSVTVHGMRKHCKLRDVVDVEPTKQPFHRDVLNYIQEVVATYSKTNYGPSTKYSYGTGGWRSQGKLFSAPSKDLSRDRDFLRGLDRNNSDLFDDDGYNYPGYSEDLLGDIMNLVTDLISAGEHTVDDVITLLDDSRDLLDYGDDDDDNVIIRMIESKGDDDDDDYEVEDLFEDTEPDSLEPMADVNYFSTPDTDDSDW